MKKPKRYKKNKNKPNSKLSIVTKLILLIIACAFLIVSAPLWAQILIFFPYMLVIFVGVMILIKILT